MIFPPCFEGCLSCQAIWFVDKVPQRIKFIHFDVHRTITKFLKDVGECCVSSFYFGWLNGSELSFDDFMKTSHSIASFKFMKEFETLAHIYVEHIKIIIYINFFVFWTIDYERTFSYIWHSKVSIRKTQNQYVAMNCFYLCIGISFLSEVYNMANNPWIGFFTKSKLETHSRKHIHGNAFGNTFVETHSSF